MDSSVLVVLILLGSVALRVLVVAGAVWLLIPRRLTCPRCAEPPLPLVSHPVLRLGRLERCWCYCCGWSGIAKRFRHAMPRDVVPRVEEPLPSAEQPWRPMADTGGWTPETDDQLS